MVDARVEAENKQLKDGLSSKPEINSAFIVNCLYANELGDGCLYAAIHLDKFIFDKLSLEWFCWNGHHWELDLLDRAKGSVEEVAECYLQEAQNLVPRIAEATTNGNKEKTKKLESLQATIYKRVKRLRSERGRINTLNFAHTNLECSLAIKGDNFDQNKFLLGVKNGVIDLRTGELLAGRPEDYINKASPIEWMGFDAPAPVWTSFLESVFENKQDIINYLRRLLGYGITGSTKEHVLPVFWGKGRNGKGTIVEVINYVLGDLAGPIQSEMLLDQGRVKNSAGPSPDIMALKGLRMAFASESDEGRRFSPSKVKWLSGGDTLTGRNPHDKYQTSFRSTHKLILLTNNKPMAPADDFAFWERVQLIEFKLSFVNRSPMGENERPADKDLVVKLRSEAPGILAWLVRGCLEWQERGGLDPPPAIKEATSEYRREEDILADFLDECTYQDPEASIGAADIYSAFHTWWEKNMSKKSVPSQKKFGKWMQHKFHREKHGTYIYYGVALLDHWK